MQIELPELPPRTNSLRKSIASVGGESFYKKVNENHRSFFMKYLDSFKNLSLLFQIIVLYMISISIFALLISLSKYYRVNSFINTQVNKVFYNNIINATLNSQREIKNKLDVMNNKNYIINQQLPLIFHEILTLELESRGYFKTENIFEDEAIGQNTIDFYGTVNETFILPGTLKEIMQNKKFNIIPILFHLLPIMYQNSVLNGYRFSSYTVMVYNAQNCQEESLFFKYPLEFEEINHVVNGKIELPASFSPYDYILDPVNKCFLSEFPLSLDSQITEIHREKISRNNYYAAIEKAFLEEGTNEPVVSKALNLLKIINNYKYTFSINTITFNRDGLMHHILFKINQKEFKRNYILTEPNGVAKNFDELILINHPNTPITRSSVSIDVTDHIYETNYNIDDNLTLIYNTPKFLLDFFTYSMLPEELKDDNYLDEYQTLINIETTMLKFSEFENVENNYAVNYYFKSESLIFRLISFLNKLLNTGECFDFGLDEYYDEVNSFYDCLYDYCYYNDCQMDDNSKSNKYNIDIENVNYKGECYCIPLFCRDKNSRNDLKFHKKIKSFFGIKDDSYDYGFMKTKKNNLKCVLSLYRRASNETTKYDAKIYIEDNPIEYLPTKIFVMLLNNNAVQLYIMNDIFRKNLMKIFVNILCEYIVLLIVICIGFCWNIILRIKDLKKEMEKVIEDLSNELSNQKQLQRLTSGGDSEEEEKNFSDEDDDFMGNKKKETGIILGTAALKEENEKKNNHNSAKDENELEQLKEVFLDNINEFQIDFDVNENITDKIEVIRKKFNDILNINECKKSLLMKPDLTEHSDEKSDFSSNLSLNDDTSHSENNNNRNDSMNILFELYSLSAKELFDFSKIKQNFYFRGKSNEDIFHIRPLISKLKNEGRIKYSEMTDLDKLNNSLNCYFETIHCYWKKLYDDSKINEND